MTDTHATASPWASPAQAAAGADQTDLRVAFTGKRGPLFWLAFKTGFFTILTVGIYRFWMKTRLRRWYWSAIRPGGHPLEYVGDPIEKLLGFFIAVVILTFYIGIVNLLLMFVSFSVFSASWVGYLASFAGVVPLWFYARYRARRYVLGRTRWRGVRFGLEKGAWGYAVRALWYWALTLLSLGILWPRMTFLLEKYRTDRTFFGSARLTQGGRWPMLYRATLPFVFSLLLLAGAALWVGWIDPVSAQTEAEEVIQFEDVIGMLEKGEFPGTLAAPERLLLFPLALAGLLFGAIYYTWVCKRIMAQHKFSDGIRFASALSGVRVAVIYVIGNFISYLALGIGLAALILGVVFLYWEAALFGDTSHVGQVWSDLPRWLTLLLLGILYLFVFLLWGVLHNTFVTFPLMRHLARTTSLPEALGLDHISQRDRDNFAEAEGFAEALDLGAAI
tara:strand:- start:1454 stop:2794 length:1341 start_codon:yes stop_codon:yes gene_type:complete